MKLNLKTKKVYFERNELIVEYSLNPENAKDLCILMEFDLSKEKAISKLLSEKYFYLKSVADKHIIMMEDKGISKRDFEALLETNDDNNSTEKNAVEEVAPFKSKKNSFKIKK